MKIKIFLIAILMLSGIYPIHAQNPDMKGGEDVSRGNTEQPQAGTTMDNQDRSSLLTYIEANVNEMDAQKREMLNRKAEIYRTRSRGIWEDIGLSMLSGGVTSVVDVISTEIINITKIRSTQKKKWREMLQKECTFVDSLQSINGQSDFYGSLSNYGPLDPTDMKFDGITLRASSGGKEVLNMVCHIDTARFDHLFMHSKFCLVVDSIVFYPYRSFLPNFSANRIQQPVSNVGKEANINDRQGNNVGIPQAAGNYDQSNRKAQKKQKQLKKETLAYWNTINNFKFEDLKDSTVTVKVNIDIFSSWINELVQVSKDVKLGSFSINIPIKKHDVKDSVYVYSRQTAEAKIDVEGECFVIPRSYMPVSAESPSWGTGEYKMKIALSENCQYVSETKRSKQWHKDYKQLVRLQNNGKAKNEYWSDIKSTMMENGSTILKATYTPAFNTALLSAGLSSDGAGGGNGGGAMKPK